MSMSQFKKWLKSHGVTQGPRCYHIPCKTLSLDVRDAEYRLCVTITTNTRDRHGDILLGMADPANGVAFAFLTSRPGDRWQTPRTQALLQAVYESLGVRS